MKRVSIVVSNHKVVVKALSCLFVQSKAHPTEVAPLFIVIFADFAIVHTAGGRWKER